MALGWLVSRQLSVAVLAGLIAASVWASVLLGQQALGLREHALRTPSAHLSERQLLDCARGDERACAAGHDIGLPCAKAVLATDPGGELTSLRSCLKALRRWNEAHCPGRADPDALLMIDARLIARCGAP